MIRKLLTTICLAAAVIGVSERAGFAADLEEPEKAGDFLGLPAETVAEAKADSVGLRQLGKKLFFDERLSVSGDMSCATCHIPRQGFTQTDRSTPTGRSGAPQRRNAPTLLNASLGKRFFHDGRSASLTDQALAPFVDPDELANISLDALIERIRGLGDYRGLFEDATGRVPDAAGVGQALAAYQRGLLAGGSAFDRFQYGRDPSALSPEARRGLDLFRGKASCSACHLIGEKAASFLDHRFHNTGIGWRSEGAANQPLADKGREEVTGRPSDRLKFKTPTLRNVAITRPYMHDGSIPDLIGVVRFYNKGGNRNRTVDPLIRPLGLSDQDMADLVVFLESLTSPRAAALGAEQ